MCLPMFTLNPPPPPRTMYLPVNNPNSLHAEKIDICAVRLDITVVLPTKANPTEIYPAPTPASK